MALEFHEPREQLPAEVIEQHRAMASLIEELEATIWYQQRAAVSGDEELAAVLRHNRDEEIEHASMLLEWLRRNFPGFDEKMQIYLFKDAPLLELEEEAEHKEQKAANSDRPGTPGGALGIGSMKGQEA
jgi:ferritin-like protein